MSKKEIVIFGVSEISELAHFYFETDSEYKVVAFTVDREFKKADSFKGLPIISFEDIEILYPPDLYGMFICLGYSKINQIRKQKYEMIKNKGYELVSYISSKATVLSKEIGDNAFILEDNTIQPFTKIGNNVVLWSGNHIGHHSEIKDHCFLASHIVVSGGVLIGECCFLGVNATLRDHINIGENTVIGAGCLILDDVEANGLYIGPKTLRADIESQKLKKI
jgi:sugar O-acyltransferase (sialic acid O-acetyltransferase NeuD family)